MSELRETSMRPITEADLKQVLSWRNCPEVRRYMLAQHEISFEEHQCWFLKASQDPARKLILFEINKNPVGFIGINLIGIGGIADWGFYLAPEAPKGAGRDLGKVVLQYVFEVLMIHKLCGQVLAFNERSIRFHMKLGFQQEGVLRQQYFDGDDYHDIICFGMLAKDWHLKPPNITLKDGTNV